MNVEPVMQDLQKMGWDVLNGPMPPDPDPDARVLALAGDPERAEQIDLEWTGPWSELQVAFGRHRIELHVTDEGAGVLKEPSGGSDLMRLMDALEPLSRKGYVILPAAAETTSAAWDEVATRSDDDPPHAVFWNHQSHESAFEGSGELTGLLEVHWSGDRALIAEHLEQSGLPVEVPEDDDATFSVGRRSKPEGTVVQW